MLALARRTTLLHWVGWLVLGAICLSFVRDPSFWRGEAAIAWHIRFPKEPLSGNFPWVYLQFIHLVNHLTGYGTAFLRAIPFAFGVVGTLIWLKLLLDRFKGEREALWLLSSLFLFPALWLFHSWQLQKVSADITFGLLPFLLSDSFYTKRLRTKRFTLLPALLLVPTFISYVYPFALLARLIALVVYTQFRPKLKVSSILGSALGVSAIFYLIWEMDQWRWSETGCQGNYPFGWFAAYPSPFLFILSLFGVLGLFHSLKVNPRSSHEAWGSRSSGSSLLLITAPLISVMSSQKICAGTLLYFAFPHLLIVFGEGVIEFFRFFHSSKKRKSLLRTALIFFLLTVIGLGIVSTRGWISYLLTPTRDNLRRFSSIMNREEAQSVWILSCAYMQILTLPEGLPVDYFPFHTQLSEIPKKERTYILWGELDSKCEKQLSEIKEKAKIWQLKDHSLSGGLAVAVF